MYQYILKRILLMIPTLFGAAVLVFFLLRLIPGDVCELRLAGTGLYADQETIDICRDNLGLNEPAIVQFFNFLWGIVTFDLGESMWTGRAVTYEIALRFQLSLQVAIMATITAVLISIPLGTISAIKQDTWIDYVVRTLSIAGIAIPSFWFGILIILGLLIFTQSWFGEPWMPPLDYVPIWVDPWRNLSQLIWPAIATGYRYSAVATRMTRSAMLEVLREDYIRTARAKGLLASVAFCAPCSAVVRRAWQSVRIWGAKGVRVRAKARVKAKAKAKVKAKARDRGKVSRACRSWVSSSSSFWSRRSSWPHNRRLKPRRPRLRLRHCNRRVRPSSR